MVGIQDPSSYSNKSIYVISNINGEMLSIATSGEYRNFKISPDGLNKLILLILIIRNQLLAMFLSVTVLTVNRLHKLMLMQQVLMLWVVKSLLI